MRAHATTQRPRRRTLAIATLMLAAATGTTAAGIMSAHADIIASGVAYGPTAAEAEANARKQVEQQCKDAGSPGVGNIVVRPAKRTAGNPVHQVDPVAGAFVAAYRGECQPTQGTNPKPNNSTPPASTPPAKARGV